MNLVEAASYEASRQSANLQALNFNDSNIGPQTMNSFSRNLFIRSPFLLQTATPCVASLDPSTLRAKQAERFSNGAGLQAPRS